MTVVMWLCVAFVAGLIFLALFRPPLEYKIRNASALDIASPDFLRQLEILGNARVQRCFIEVLTDGNKFYEAELKAIDQARRSIHFEAYIFHAGQVADRFMKALAERARAGVEVRVVLDAVGSFTTSDDYLREVTEASGQIFLYNPIRWHTWDRYNNRTHREILVVDSEIGFVGGAGVADWWLNPSSGQRSWRDCMFLLRGEAVEGLESIFVENWAEAAGEILSFQSDLRPAAAEGDIPALVIGGTPSAGGSTRHRIVFQTFLASARKSLFITNPYFLPDQSITRQLIAAVRERGADVRIITSGKKSDQSFTRSASRRLYGSLIEAGVKIYEYQPAMNHAKTMLIDGLWSIVGTTNFDSRSFGLNDEVNLVACSKELTRRIEQDFLADLEHSRRITLHDWTKRPAVERVLEQFSGLLERQQ
jgi:cardiolipin synthase